MNREGDRPEGPARTGRELAIRVLYRVFTEDAWAAPALDGELSRASLSSSEAARATDLVFGVLRSLPRLDARIDRHRPRRDPIEPYTHACLLTATYELLHTPEKPWAVLDETVGMVRRARAEALSRFVNAVLRKLAAERPESPERPRTIAVPAWLETLLGHDLGAERAGAFLGERPMPPPLALRARVPRETLMDQIRGARPGADVRAGELTSAGVLVRGGGDPRRLPGFDYGAFVVMDEASQLVARAVGARAGERVLDACAGRGGKTLALLDQMTAGPGDRPAALVAADDHPDKLARMDPELRRLGHEPSLVSRRAVDLSVGLGGLAEGSFDRVLVDAPCTGLGTVHRRPEILLRVGPDDPARLGELQLAIASRAASLVRPGGLLVLAVCTPTRAEGIDVVEALLGAVPGLAIVREPVDGVPCDDDGVVRIGPWADPSRACDAFQVTRLRRAG